MFWTTPAQRQRTDDPRYTFGLTPFASHELTPLDTLSANSSWRQREDTRDDGIDFTTLSGQVGWLRTVTRRLRLGGNLYANHYNSDLQESDLISPRFSAAYSGSEVLDFDLSLGPSLSRTETKRDNAGCVGRQRDPARRHRRRHRQPAARPGDPRRRSPSRTISSRRATRATSARPRGRRSA